MLTFDRKHLPIVIHAIKTASLQYVLALFPHSLEMLTHIGSMVSHMDMYPMPGKYIDFLANYILHYLSSLALAMQCTLWRSSIRLKDTDG